MALLGYAAFPKKVNAAPPGTFTIFDVRHSLPRFAGAASPGRCVQLQRKGRYRINFDFTYSHHSLRKLVFKLHVKFSMKKFILVFVLFIAGLLVYFSLGSAVTKNIDTYIYDLPFAPGAKHKVVQGYGGLFSHKHKAALDFDMPVGTPVFAAREGEVYTFKDDSDEGGPFPKYEKKANYIIIKHSDGSFGCYWHLKHNGVLVKHGRVIKGQLLGYSGRTGFVLWPHLHFAVKRQLNYDKDSFVRTKFKTTSGIKLLKSGDTYEKPSK